MNCAAQLEHLHSARTGSSNQDWSICCCCRTLTLQSYTKAGGVSGAIVKTADEVMQSLRPEQRLIALSIFLRLTELGEGTQDTRRRAAEAVETEQVLRTLTDALDHNGQGRGGSGA